MGLKTAVLFIGSLLFHQFHICCEALPSPWDTASFNAHEVHGVKAKRLLIDHDGGVDDLIALMLLLAVPQRHGELVGVIVTEVKVDLGMVTLNVTSKPRHHFPISDSGGLCGRRGRQHHIKDSGSVGCT